MDIFIEKLRMDAHLKKLNKQIETRNNKYYHPVRYFYEEEAIEDDYNPSRANFKYNVKTLTYIFDGYY